MGTAITDVAIIGAGPGGSVAAALLASRGFRVALIDRDTFPRDKLCGEFLSFDALPVLALLGVGLPGAPVITACRVFGSSSAYEFPLPAPCRGVSRMLLDRLLFEEAIRRGAEDWSGATVGGVTTSSSSHLLTVTNPSGEKRIEARHVIGAWGRWGRIDLQLRRPFASDSEHRHFGFKRHYLARRAGERTDTIDIHSFDDGYLGVSHVEGGVTNICGLVHRQRLSGHRGRWDAFLEQVASERTSVRRLLDEHEPAQAEFLSSDPVVFRQKSSVEQRMLLVGDSSGLIDPLAGNGMAMAMQSALIAAIAVRRILEGRTSEEAGLHWYAENHAATFAARIRWSRAVAMLLGRPRLIDAATRLPVPARLGSLLARRTRGAVADVTRFAEEWSS